VIHDNLLVAYLVVHPRMPIDPRLLGFKTSYKRSVSQVILANSITLSPGTMTVLAEDNHYIIHALIPSSCEGLINAGTQTRVAKIYDEAAEQLPEAECGYTFEEVA
ncbi:MAG: Na+/H+ antiporter subunit E, partial [Dehalococcoidales bacterium]|nr:Na+/H+ antiporter subunit E [Dehalococcoidales bacterium]